ncbi:gluconate 2-dehydrogenase [Bordetella genomosp. 5]|uniref:gluconate 2-dehydrogenase subunit 3 family protein n=1 Tax=Bordetella genomosp. 5 TaxID=1395608 RepID=UPI000B9EAA82|nr:gluconate 2-dehydrogenase subunit 3 family protein [Bordetella genomosp. 5]OZI43775.1 gluconate 2-dehydrogenase [Bordetella genomosp. 5]
MDAKKTVWSATAGDASAQAPEQPTRRHLLKALTVGVPGALALRAAQAQPAAVPVAPPLSTAKAAEAAPLRFFNPREATLMDAIAARLIPADDLGPGAKEAGVTRFLDGQLAGAWGAGDHLYRQGPFETGTPEQGYQLSFTPADMYRRGLAAFDEVVRKKDGKAFAELPAEAQDAWLTALQEGKPDLGPLPAALFFQALLEGTIEGFFSDPLYGGNVDMAGWKLVGFPGAYASFSNDIERHGVPWQGEPVSIAQSRPHHEMHREHGGDAHDVPAPATGGTHG